ncbi:hypothetical protein SUGI_1155890 [Cryptomeria japonica]|uniref:conserved oligomeric Golgi complex subunit 1 n=1 Tax=Cryptomeria japonica TaxID=3369 RepID=UPI0024146912|nr:conserved oligomeric Golgi complex subunit 1 [Cryptomeria japonica]GLJ54019.1 hypothetical protein SUGI_1155890 [Cryptomeria japonica]
MSMSTSMEVATVRNAEALFETRRIVEIREVESQTRKEIEEKQEDLRQLVGHSYRDLIESADSILLMKKSCQAVSQNILNIQSGFRSINTAIYQALPLTPKLMRDNKKMGELYAIGSRVKYLVDTAENIWGCLDEHMFLEASGRYLRAKEVYSLLVENNKELLEKSFPLLRHQWQLVENFRGQISQRSRDRLLEQGLGIESYAVALAAVAVIDELNPKQVFALFLDTRKSWLRQRSGLVGSGLGDKVGAVSSIFCNVVRVIQVTLCQAGELFLEVLNDLPLFYKTVLAVPPGSQLFGGIPNPDNEVQLWKSHREKLQATMTISPSEFITESCLAWLKTCADDILSADRLGGKYLLDLVKSGKELAENEKLIRKTLDSLDAFEGSLEWLKTVFGSNVEFPWQCVCEIVLKHSKSLWDDLFESLFVIRMKQIIADGFTDLRERVKIGECLEAIVTSMASHKDVEAHLHKLSTSEGWLVKRGDLKSVNLPGLSFRFLMTNDEDWFGRLNAYFGTEVSQIKDTIDEGSKNILEDLLSFLHAHKSSSRINDLAPYLQEQCFCFISTLIVEIEEHLAHLSEALYQKMKIEEMPEKLNKEKLEPTVIVERALLLGRLLVTLSFHSNSLPLVLGSSQLWFVENKASVSGKGSSTFRYSSTDFDYPLLDNSGRQILMRGVSLKPESQDKNNSTKLNKLRRTMHNLCIRAYSMWILSITEELSGILKRDLRDDDSLSMTTPLKGWEETELKQEHEGGGQLDTKIYLPAMPSLYVTAFLFQGCQEIYRIGGHVLDKIILQLFAWRLLEKVLNTYENFLPSSEDFQSQVSEKGLLQILFDIRFIADVLSGGRDVPLDTINAGKQDNWPDRDRTSPASSKSKPANSEAPEASMRKRVSVLTQNLSKKLDPIDWATYEPYLWENERQSYLRGAVLFGLLVQLNRMYTDTKQKLPTHSDRNTMKGNTAAPRLKYLPISAPSLSSNGTPSSAMHQAFSDDLTARGSWKGFSNGNLSSKFDFEDTSSFGVATPLLKSLMSQVGSRFGEGTFRLGSMLSDGQVGRLKDKSAAAMSTFGDMLPVQAAGLLSSLTVGAGRPE